MTPSKEVPVETDLAVRRLIARYCHLLDDRDFKAITGLFTEDARFRIGDRDFHGVSAVAEWLASTPDGLFHAVTNVVVSYGSRPDTVHAVSDVAAWRRADEGWALVLRGRYHDTFGGTGRDLRFSQRLLTPL